MDNITQLDATLHQIILREHGEVEPSASSNRIQVMLPAASDDAGSGFFTETS